MPFQDQGQTSSRACVGKIVAAHGVKGLVKILPYGDDLSLLEGDLYVSDKDSKTLKIKIKNPIGKYVLAEAGGVTERNGAEALRNTELFIEKQKLPELKEEGRYYHADLIGLRALDENGQEIGTIAGIENYGAGDLLSIKPAIGKEFLYPFTQDNVPEVNLKAGTMTTLNTQEFKDL